VQTQAEQALKEQCWAHNVLAKQGGLRILHRAILANLSAMPRSSTAQACCEPESKAVVF
jgi:hypothetical protein